jgi:hypothetical protein
MRIGVQPAGEKCLLPFAFYTMGDMFYLPAGRAGSKRGNKHAVQLLIECLSLKPFLTFP